MKIAYFDCIAGASGDMILGALLDAGLSLETLRERLEALHLRDFELRVRRVAKNAFTATKVDVVVVDDVPERHLSDIERIVTQSDLDAGIKAQALAIFRRMGEVEAGIHGASVEHVHLHELGGVDTIVDVVGALVGLDALGIEAVYASPLPLGRGFVRGAHGQIPLPAPATLGLLSKREGGVPIVGSPLAMETVTPTGAALLSMLALAFGPLPAMTLETVGYGAGSRDLPIPNVLRVLIGQSGAELQSKAATHSHDHGHGHTHDHEHDHEHPHHEHSHAGAAQNQLDALVMLETNIDDLNPEIYGYVMDKLFAAGALDVFFSPVQMKKNRPATMLHVLCSPERADVLKACVFAETSTLGIREHVVQREALPRESRVLDTPYGAVRVKVAQLAGGVNKSAPEYEDCRLLAEQQDVPLRQVYAAVRLALGETDFKSATL